MPAAEEPRDRLMVAVQDEMAFVHVYGRGSFKISTNLKQFGVAAIEAHCRYLVLDMADCMGMDSTFMGVLAGLAFRLKQRRQGDVLLINLSPRTSGLLTTLGLDQVVKPFLAGTTPPELADLVEKPALEQVPENQDENRLSATQMMLQAHEDLVRLNEENLPKFKDVLTFLREDLRREGKDGGSSAASS